MFITTMNKKLVLRLPFRLGGIVGLVLLASLSAKAMAESVPLSEKQAIWLPVTILRMPKHRKLLPVPFPTQPLAPSYWNLAKIPIPIRQHKGVLKEAPATVSIAARHNIILSAS